MIIINEIITQMYTNKTPVDWIMFNFGKKIHIVAVNERNGTITFHTFAVYYKITYIIYSDVQHFGIYLKDW